MKWTKGWQEFKKSFTSEQEQAIWQYFLDHSKIQFNGYWKIQFFVKNVDDFWRRVAARHTGEFKRYDRMEREQIQNKHFKTLGEKKSKTEICEEIDNGKSLKNKVILWVFRRSRDYLFPKT